MAKRTDFGDLTNSTFDQPEFLALTGEPAELTLALLMQKGRPLTPSVTAKEAQGIMRYMNLEHFRPGSKISFNAQSEETGRLMLILAGEANLKMMSVVQRSAMSDFSPLGQVQSKWFNVCEGATLGLLHAFSGLSSRFVAQCTTELFVASMTRQAFHYMKQQEPVLALRFLEITTLELALVALDHERNLVAMSNVARSMQEHIGDESGDTKAAPLDGLDSL